MIEERAEKPKWKKLVFYGIVLFIIVFLYKSLSGRTNQQVISPLPDTPSPSPKRKFKIFTKEKTSDELAKKISSVIGDKWNDYSVVVEDYTSPLTLKQSEGEIFVAASVNKVPILAALYYYAGKGDIDLDTDITLQAQDIQDYGTGSIRYDKPGAVYPVKTLAKLMIKQSDNTAAYILANHIIGFDKLNALMTQWGLIQTDLVNNKTSNQDIAKLFRMIYEGKVTNPAFTQEMLSFLKDTDFETRLPAGLPESATVYHKIGTEVGTIHDAGVISDGTVTYYLGIFTNGTTEGEETDALMAKISKTVYDYVK